jgi:hypothetical protein
VRSPSRQAVQDDAFFSDAIVGRLASLGVEFTVSVPPFERFTELKSQIEERKRWRNLGAGLADLSAVGGSGAQFQSGVADDGPPANPEHYRAAPASLGV